LVAQRIGRTSISFQASCVASKAMIVQEKQSIFREVQQAKGLAQFRLSIDQTD
jgi:hypothetical protein